MNEGQGTIEALLLAGAAVASAVLVAGAELAALLNTGAPISAPMAMIVRSVFTALAHASDPRLGWPRDLRSELPGPVGYWASTAVVAAVTGGLALLGARLYRRFAGDSRTRLGVEVSARLARRSDLSRLILRRPTPGRFVLGRLGRWRIATENVDAPPTGRTRARPPQRTSVAMVGPTRCGKTAAAITGILEWTGPAILSSVKSDLMAATIGWRRSVGEVRVFDPTGLTSRATCGWSLLRGATTASGAQRAARALVDAGPRRGAQDLDFFLRLSEQVLWPLFFFAADQGRSMREVVEWVLTQKSPIAEDSSLRHAIELSGLASDSARREDARQAEHALLSVWGFDHRTRSSAYATAHTLMGAWTDTGVLDASETEDIDLEWLLSGANTLYICSPLHEQQRLSPVFGSLLGDLVSQAYERDVSTGKPMPTTLLLLDEAANTPTRWLPNVASTCAGIGLLLVTIWQSKAQLDSAYGDLADSVLTNHGTKLIFSGASDLPTLEYAGRLLGDEEIVQRGTTLDQRDGHQTVNLSSHRVPLLPTHVLRQTRPGHAVLVHADLPPAHLRTSPYYRDKKLKARSESGTSNFPRSPGREL
jgi:type IV secretion system protein VirD4